LNNVTVFFSECSVTNKSGQCKVEQVSSSTSLIAEEMDESSTSYITDNVGEMVEEERLIEGILLMRAYDVG